MVPYVRENLFRGESFTGLAEAQRRVEVWCATMAGLRVRDARVAPAEPFTTDEAPRLLPAPRAATTAASGPPGHQEFSMRASPPSKVPLVGSSN
jgi:hypothetical protein